MTKIRTKQSRGGIAKIGAVTLLITGFSLMLLNVVGLFLSMENPNLLTNDSGQFPKDKTVLLKDFMTAYPRQLDETNADFVVRVNTLVSESIFHYLWEDREGPYYRRIPVWENYLLTLASFLPNEDFQRYAFFDWRKAVERGVGICSQSTMVLTSVLEEAGIPARILQLSLHTLAEVTIDDDTIWLVDPDFGVVVPHSTEEIVQRPELITPYYTEVHAACRACEKPFKKFVDLYRDPYTLNEPGMEAYSTLWLNFEKALYVMKWLIPLILIGAGMLLKRIYRSR